MALSATAACSCFIKVERNGEERVREGMNKTTISLAAFAATITASAALLAAPASQDLMKEAKISRAEAAKTALAQVPNGVIKSEELEREHGKLIWSFDVAKNDTKNITEVQVDAKSGKIVSIQVETPRDQAKEAAADKKEK